MYAIPVACFLSLSEGLKPLHSATSTTSVGSSGSTTNVRSGSSTNLSTGGGEDDRSRFDHVSTARHAVHCSCSVHFGMYKQVVSLNLGRLAA